MAAAERFAGAPLPTTEEEVWRYSRVDELDLDRYQPSAAPSDRSTLHAPAASNGSLTVDRPAAVVTVRDGQVAGIHVDSIWADRGLVVAPVAQTDGGESALGSVLRDAPDAFAELNDAFAADPVLVRVPRGLSVEAPVVVQNSFSADGVAAFPRLVVQADENSSVTVVDHYRSAEALIGLVVPVVELAAARAGRLGYVGVQELGPHVWHIGTQVSDVGQEASLVAGTAALGGEYARLRSDCRLSGRGGTGTLLAAYFGEGHQTLDFRTFQDHRAPDTTSNLLFKGAVGGHSRSVYTGLIRVRKNAHGTNAFQTNRNIKLSDHAWAESVPNLEIENNDVRCSHASAVGPIDAEQRFYLESRGIRPGLAERLVVSGFFDEVLSQLPAAGVVSQVRDRIEAKLDRQEFG